MIRVIRVIEYEGERDQVLRVLSRALLSKQKSIAPGDVVPDIGPILSAPRAPQVTMTLLSESSHASDTLRCRHCSRPLEDHHEFAPEVPEGCQCDAFEWHPNKVGPICDSHKGDPSMPCHECEHDSKCHPPISDSQNSRTREPMLG